MSVLDALWALVRHPHDRLVRHWNWKAAVLSAAVRGAIFFGVNLTAGSAAAMRALGLDVPLRLGVAGFSGAIVQTLRQAEPRWAASLTTVVLLALLTHGLEYVVHASGGTPRLRESMLASVAFSAVTAMMNLVLMRRGILLVGTGALPLGEDLRAMGRLLVQLVRAIGRAMPGGGRRA